MIDGINILITPIHNPLAASYHVINPALLKNLFASLTFQIVTICLLDSNVSLNRKPHLYLIFSLDSTEVKNLKFRLLLIVTNSNLGSLIITVHLPSY